MKKKIVCLMLALVFVFSMTSCFKGDRKYNYKDMSKYMDLANYKDFVAVVEMDKIQATMDSYLVDKADEYKVQKGDKVTIKLSSVYGVALKDGKEEKGEQIKDLEKEFTVVIGNNEFCEKIESALINLQIDKSVNSQSNNAKLSDKFEIKEYQGQSIYYNAKVTSIERAVKEGDIVSVEYKGCYIDDDGNIIMEKDSEGKETEKTFDSGTTKAFIGAHIAIDDFENGLKGAQFGKEVEFFATFPEDYNQFDKDGNDLSGKKVKFKCTVKKYYITPIMNDEFVKDKIDGYDTVEELEKGLIDNSIRNLISQNLQDKTTIKSFPKHEYKSEESIMEDNLKNSKPYGLSYEQYLSLFYQCTPTQYIENKIKTEMIYYAIAKNENIEPSKEKVNDARNEAREEYIQSYMKNNNVSRDVAEDYANIYMDQIGPYEFYDQELFTLVDNFLFENTKTDKKERTKVSISQTMAEKESQKNDNGQAD